MDIDFGSVFGRKHDPMSRDKVRSFLSRDPAKSAEKAMDALARSGQWLRAAQLAGESGDDEKLVRFCLMSGLGKVPEGRRLDLSGAAELLAAKGRHEEAILLFERAGASLQAAESARAAKDPLRASRYYKQAGAWLQGVRCLEEAGKLREALQLSEEGCLSLERAKGGSLAGAGRLEELIGARVELLVKMGRGETAARLLNGLPPSPRTAELLAHTGKFLEAVECYLGLGLVEDASQLAARSPERDRLQAQIFLRTGRAIEAGDLLARNGRPREAAEAYEAAGDWGRAAYRWEAASDPLRAAQAYDKAGRVRDAARCYEAAGMPRQAEEVAARAATRTASRPRPTSRALQVAHRCLESGDKARAASLLLQMRPEEPGFGEGTLLLVPLLIEEGFGQDALDRLRTIPRDAALQHEMEIEYWVGRSHEALGQKDVAIACFERLMARAPSHRDARERLLALKSPPRIPTASVLEPLDLDWLGPATVAPPVPFPAVGTRYEILAELGRGGMGRIYRARDRELDEVVAIKTLLTPDDSTGEETRLLREVQICRRISHPNVVRVYDIGRFAGGLFVTMELLEGMNLDRVLEEETPLPFARVRFFLSEIAAGLQEAHAQGIVHRDLKPANLMVAGNRLKILDFGIASMSGLGARLTQTGCVMGTPMYMSPDQLLGRELDGRSDLYSLGIVAYTLIAGREPFEPADPTVLALRQLQEPAPDIRRFRPETPEPWMALLDRLLKKDPQDRFQTAQEVLDALAALPVDPAPPQQA